MKFDPFTDELLRLDSDVNKAVIRFFGNLPHEEILTDLLSDSWVYIDTYEKLSCAIALNSTWQAITAAIEGRLSDMVKYLGHANKHLGICLDRSGSQSERASNPRQDPLNTLISEILTDNPAMTEKEVLEALYDFERMGVIEEIDKEESLIYYIKDGRGGFSAPISGLKDRVSRIKKKIYSR
jgi:hypothetical protein